MNMLPQLRLRWIGSRVKLEHWEDSAMPAILRQKNRQMFVIFENKLGRCMEILGNNVIFPLGHAPRLKKVQISQRSKNNSWKPKVCSWSDTCWYLIFSMAPSRIRPYNTTVVWTTGPDSARSIHLNESQRCIRPEVCCDDIYFCMSLEECSCRTWNIRGMLQRSKKCHSNRRR